MKKELEKIISDFTIVESECIKKRNYYDVHGMFEDCLKYKGKIEILRSVILRLKKLNEAIVSEDNKCDHDWISGTTENDVDISVCWKCGEVD